MKPIDCILQDAVSIRNTFVLAHVLEPGIDEKGLDHPSFRSGVLKYCPGICTIAPAFLS
jgi:hypothetical protein